MKHAFHLPSLILMIASLCLQSFTCRAQTAVVIGGPGTSGMALQPDRNASGTISAFHVGGLTLVDTLGSTTIYLVNSETRFLDMRGHPVERRSITPDTPVTVYFTAVGTTFLATKIVMGGSFFSDGTLVEVKPGGLLLEPGALATPVRYVSNGATKYVNQKEEPVQAFHSGAVVRIFYTKVGDALVAGKVELLPGIVQAPATQRSASHKALDQAMILRAKSPSWQP